MTLVLETWSGVVQTEKPSQQPRVTHSNKNSPPHQSLLHHHAIHFTPLTSISLHFKFSQTMLCRRSVATRPDKQAVRQARVASYHSRSSPLECATSCVLRRGCCGGMVLKLRCGLGSIHPFSSVKRRPLTHSQLTHSSLTAHSPTLPLTHPLTHSLTHSCIHLFCFCSTQYDDVVPEVFEWMG